MVNLISLGEIYEFLRPVGNLNVAWDLSAEDLLAGNDTFSR